MSLSRWDTLRSGRLIRTQNDTFVLGPVPIGSDDGLSDGQHLGVVRRVCQFEVTPQFDDGSIHDPFRGCANRRSVNTKSQNAWTGPRFLPKTQPKPGCRCPRRQSPAAPHPVVEARNGGIVFIPSVEPIPDHAQVRFVHPAGGDGQSDLERVFGMLPAGMADQRVLDERVDGGFDGRMHRSSSVNGVGFRSVPFLAIANAPCETPVVDIVGHP